MVGNLYLLNHTLSEPPYTHLSPVWCRTGTGDVIVDTWTVGGWGSGGELAAGLCSVLTPDDGSGWKEFVSRRTS